MDYMKWSREKLIERIDELTLLSAQLLRERNQESRLDYDWTGNLGHWYWNIKTNSVTFNPLKVTTLGYELPEDGSPVPYQFFTEKLHPDDYEPTMNAMRDHLSGTIHVYEVEYRIQAVDGTWPGFTTGERLPRMIARASRSSLPELFLILPRRRRPKKRSKKKTTSLPNAPPQTALPD